MRLEQVPYHLRSKLKGVRIVTSKSLGVFKNKEGQALCKWCLSVVEHPRRFWCSDHCSWQFELLKNCPKQVFYKYEGKCSVCRTDVVKLQNTLNEIWNLYHEADSLRQKLERSQTIEDEFPSKSSDYWKMKKADVNMYQTIMVNLSEIAGQYPSWLKHLRNGLFRPKHYKAFEIDHVRPICEGGTTTTDNLRLLCGACHCRTTAELEERRKKREKNS